MKGSVLFGIDRRGIFIIMNKIIRSVMAALLSILFILALPMGVSAAGTKELIVA
jgi:hypothetical protein